jgi:thioredoxin 1
MKRTHATRSGILRLAAVALAGMLLAGCTESPPEQQQSAAGTNQTAGGTSHATAPVKLTAASFDQQVLQSDKPVLVDFYATWCGPCKRMEPIIHELAGDYAGRAVVAQIDVDQAQEIAARYGIQYLPTFAVFKDGKVVEQVVGAQNKEDLAAKIDAALAN